MKKVIFGFILVSVLLSACSPKNYFLFNSDMMAKYNRTKGDWEVVWNTSLKHIGLNPDTIPMVVQTDSITQHND